ncbi:MAG: alpha/beta hydrolase [Gammaproteobacteria bacterium]|nr:alpha/beta hydrolase [Gammaproteobacteria bacterium]
MTDPEELPNWLTEEDLDYFTREFQRAGFRGGLNWYRNLDHNWVLSAPFQGMKVNQPALYIIGERDVTRGFLSAEQLREVVPNLTDVVTFPGIGHWTQQENPKGTNEALLKFLDSLG